MGAVVETPSIYLNMTAEENLRHQYMILGRPSFDGIRELLELVGLSRTGRKKAKDFFSRYAPAPRHRRCPCRKSDFLVLDEPVNGLDPQGIIEMRELILKLNQEHQITFLISSHILDELSRLATHYGFIDKGHMIKEISARDLENACRKGVHVDVSDTGVLSCILDEEGLEYKILTETYRRHLWPAGRHGACHETGCQRLPS